MEINIFDQTLIIKSDRDENYIRMIADYVDKKIRELQGITKTTEPQKVIILAALNIADEYFGIKEERKSFFEFVENRSKELITIIERTIL